jgi:hypothetical protein
MIIGWPGVPVLRRASQVSGVLRASAGRSDSDCTISWCHGVAERSGPGFKSNRWFMFSRLKGLGTSSSHAGGSSSETRTAAAAAVTDILSHKSESGSSRFTDRDSIQPSSLIQWIARSQTSRGIPIWSRVVLVTVTSLKSRSPPADRTRRGRGAKFRVSSWQLHLLSLQPPSCLIRPPVSEPQAAAAVTVAAARRGGPQNASAACRWQEP